MDQIQKNNKKHRHNTSTHKSSHQPDKSTENSIFYNMTIDLTSKTPPQRVSKEPGVITVSGEKLQRNVLLRSWWAFSSLNDKCPGHHGFFPTASKQASNDVAKNTSACIMYRNRSALSQNDVTPVRSSAHDPC